ncbi:MAG: 16S rRNA (adenine(1518)-N(6)/adenine(1519)-N(6))-dimethyltransferase [Betaproteobacteria bacterium HGW-Betaproteobacteria-13]|nr:MAG: 16S rRNA (adenine(1518)-N(6)/adenine(1519)-N(6))-dimethyltransferase [Betaproteobacteria bacterium HGW-Betaproteobacteria-13]
MSNDRETDGHRARKRFGQNFLSDPNRIDHLHVVEIDRDLIARLRERYSPERLSIHEGDALKFDFGTLGDPLRIVGNLPYNISTPILFHLAAFAEQVQDMTFMLQKEVVMRMVAEPGTEDYGRLSVMLQYRFRMGRMFDVPPGAFRPAPKVMSSIVRLVPLPAEELTARDEVLLGAIVTAAFGQRRKTLRNTLREFLDEAGFAALGLDPGLRGERLSVAEFVAIANYCSSAGKKA